MYKILVWDIETQTHPWYGNVASSFNPDNYIVASGYRLDTVDDAGQVHVGNTQYVYYNSKEEFLSAPVTQWLPIEPNVNVVVAHNSQFEIKWALTHGRNVLEEFLKRGGRIACTAMAEYLLSHQQELYPSLSETAVKHGGTHKVDGVKVLWEAGVLTSEIDKDLLIEYLAGPSGDIDNTAISFYDQQRQLAEAGMSSMYWERCDALLAFAYCEWFGLYVNRDVAERNLAAQEAEIADLQKELYKLLPTDLPEALEFNWGSDYHMSALVYGGPVKYRHRVPYDPPQYVKADFYKGCADKLIPVGEEQEWDLPYLTRYASGKNKGQLKVFREDTDEEKLKWEETSVQLPGLVNLSALPDGVREKYIGKRAEFKGARTLCDGVTPVYSTSTDALKGLKNFVPEVALMVKLASLEKDTGAFYRRVEYNADGSVKKESGLLQYVGPDGIVHHSLNATATVTTRLSASKPNMQQIPRDGTSKVKEMFSSRFGAGGRVVEVDYSALEVVMLCAITKDTDLLNLLLNNTDMHCYRLAFQLGEEYSDVYEKCHNESHPEHKRYKQMRTDVKPLSFADQYGASAEGIAFNVGCTVEFAQQFQENEMKLFPISRGYRKVIADEVERTGNLPGSIHREQTDGGLWRVYRRGYFTGPSTTRYSFRQHPVWDKETRQEVMSYKATQMANYPMQGDASFMMSTAMGRICRWLIQNDWFGGTVCLINNVHDCCHLDCANPDIALTAGRGIKSIMEDMPRYLTEKFPAFDMADVPFPAAMEIGTNLMDKAHAE